MTAVFPRAVFPDLHLHVWMKCRDAELLVIFTNRETHMQLLCNSKCIYLLMWCLQMAFFHYRNVGTFYLNVDTENISRYWINLNVPVSGRYPPSPPPLPCEVSVAHKWSDSFNQIKVVPEHNPGSNYCSLINAFAAVNHLYNSVLSTGQGSGSRETPVG